MTYYEAWAEAMRRDGLSEKQITCNITAWRIDNLPPNGNDTIPRGQEEKAIADCAKIHERVVSHFRMAPAQARKFYDKLIHEHRTRQ